MRNREQPLILNENDLYAEGQLIVDDKGKPVFLEAKPYRTPANPSFVLHTVVEGDELTGLAFRYYSGLVIDASKYWHLIANENNIETPYDLSNLIGEDIRIPDVIQYRLQ